MDRIATVAAALAIAFACVACALVMAEYGIDIGSSTEPATDSDDTRYSITYVLDGGTLPDAAPSTYTPGEELDIPNPAKDGLIFEGWYTDPDLTVFFDGNTSGLTGDIILYAAWGESISGHSIVFSKSGYYESGINSYTISGSLTCTYLYYSEEMGSYYIRNDDVTTQVYTHMGKQSYTQENTSSYWSSNIERDAYDGGVETIETINGPKECQVTIFEYSSGMTETQWTEVDGWITYKMVSEYEGYDSFHSVKYYVEYVLVSETVSPVDTDCDVTVIEGYGIEVSGNEGTYYPGTSVTLTAKTESGVKFAGWYDENLELLSSRATYTFVIGGDMKIYALNANSYDLTLSSDTQLDLDTELGVTGGTYVITDMTSGSEYAITGSTFTFDDGGLYSILANSSDGDEYFVVMVSGDITRTFEWKYKGTTYTVSLDIAYDDYIYSKDLFSVSERQQSTRNSHAHDKLFVTYSYEDSVMAPYMEELVDKLISTLQGRYSNIDETTLLNFLLTFTQYIEYQADGDYMGTDEYWKFPLETLFDQGGDCEDTSILFCALAHECRDELDMDYRTAMLLLPGHMAGAIRLSSSTSWSYCETTASGYDVGEIPDSMKEYTKSSRYFTVVEVE